MILGEGKKVEGNIGGFRKQLYDGCCMFIKKDVCGVLIKIVQYV